LKLLKKKGPGKPVFVCANDAMALGALRALKRRGLACPADAGVTGFDGIPETAVSHPPLATVRVPLRRIAEAACRYLLALVRREKTPPPAPVKKCLSYEVLLRPSV
jgi:LacI family transcriptional regulator